jgi:hypothetical protein
MAAVQRPGEVGSKWRDADGSGAFAVGGADNKSVVVSAERRVGIGFASSPTCQLRFLDTGSMTGSGLFN